MIRNAVFKRHELRKLANQKHRDPLNAILREEYHAVLKQYKTLLNNKTNEYYNNKISELENTTFNSDQKHFWNCLKSMDDSVKQKVTPEISEENWLRHFQSLHSNDLLNPDQQNIVNELRKQQDSNMQSRPLDYPITELEIRTAVKKLKNNKSPYSDKIRNEMIKASLNEMMPVYHKLFNNILNGGSMPLMWCSGLITPIFKSGGRNDPTNYRGICVSSCLGKLFCSILNQRLMEHVNSLNILHNSQIGFLPNNRTADHVLTLRTLIDKYVHCHQEKVYACFVDFRKAFDSVWHDGLLYKLLQINVGGNFYDLIKNLYYNSTGSVRIGDFQTQSFQYARGVRQGCILSPLLFNLYINDLPYSFENILSDPFVLPNGTKLSSLLYADDLIILSRSKAGLQNCLNTLAQYCRSWMLNINPKKNKIMIFQRRAKKIDYNFYIGNEKIDIVQSYTYLGTQISSTGNFTLSLEHLREKAVHALFSFSTPLYSTPLHCTPLHSTPLYSTPLHSTVLHSTPLHCTPLHSTPLYSTPLHSTVLHSTVLHSTVLPSPPLPSPPVTKHIFVKSVFRLYNYPKDILSFTNNTMKLLIIEFTHYKQIH